MCKENVHANCNMAIFQRGKGNTCECEKYIKKSSKASEDNIDSLQKLAYTLCELDMHEEARAKLKLLLHTNPYDIKALFCLAVTCVNSGNLQMAMKYFGDILKIDPYNTMAQYYKKHISSPDFNGYVSYVYEIPPLEALSRIKLLESCIGSLDENVKGYWRNDDYFVSVCVWGISHEETGIALCALKIIGFAGDNKAKDILSGAILNKKISDEIKNAIFTELNKLDVLEPFVAYINGEIVEVRTSRIKYADKIPVGYQLVEIGIHDVFDGDQEKADAALKYWAGYIKTLKGVYPKIAKPYLWVCAVAYLLIGEKIFEESEGFTISQKGIINTANKIKKRLEENHDNN